MPNSVLGGDFRSLGVICSELKSHVSPLIHLINSPSSLEPDTESRTSKLQVRAIENFPWSGTGSFVVRSYVNRACTGFLLQRVKNFCFVGDPRFHDMSGTIFGSIRDIDCVKNEKSKFQLYSNDQWKQLTATLESLAPPENLEKPVPPSKHTSVCRAFIYAYEFKKSDTLLWTVNKPPFAGSDLVLQRDPDSHEFYPPKGWEWAGAWMVDTSGLSDGIGCDPEGWQYSRFLGDIEEVEINDWVAIPDDRHRLRRRRLVRILGREDDSDTFGSFFSGEIFYEYSNNYWDEYFPFSAADELFRRSLWVRRLENNYSEGNIAKLPSKIALLDAKGSEVVSQVYHILKSAVQSSSWVMFSYIYQCQVRSYLFC